MNERSFEMKCPVCQHRFSSTLDEKVLTAMAIYCPGCNLKVSLEGFNTTTGMVIVGRIPNAVMNEHVAKMQDEDWKKGYN